MIQELAKIGYDSFKGLIVFIKQILKIGRINYQKYYVATQQNVQLRQNAKERGVPISNHECGEELTKQKEWRHLRDIDKTMGKHAKQMKMNHYTLRQRWISYEHNRDSTLIDTNPHYAKHKQRQFNKLQQKLWSEYHNNKDRLRNTTLNIVNRRQSYRDIQSNRECVCFVSFL